MREPSSVALLQAWRFKDGPFWPKSNDPSSFARFHSDLPTLPGVYAIVVGDDVRYVGKAQKQGISNRLRKYTTAKKPGAVASRIRTGISEAVGAGHTVRVFYLTPSTRPRRLDGLPINLVEGIEAGVIQELQPIWNRRGLVRDEEDDDEIAD